MYGGHFLALGTASIAASGSFLAGRSPSILLLVMAYLFSYGAYMLNRGTEVTQDGISNPDRTDFLQGRSRYLTTISGVSFGAGYLIAAFVNFIFLIALTIPLLLALAYTVGSKKFVKIMGSKRLKEKLLVKNIVISLGWSLIPLLVGLYYQSIPVVLLAFAPFIFLRLMSNTVFFDLRDVKADRDFGVRTIPVALGSTKAYRLMSLFDVLSALYVIALTATHFFPTYCLVLVSLPIYSVFYRWASQRPGANLGVLCDFIADGEYLLWGPVMLFGKII